MSLNTYVQNVATMSMAGLHSGYLERPMWVGMIRVMYHHAAWNASESSAMNAGVSDYVRMSRGVNSIAACGVLVAV